MNTLVRRRLLLFSLILGAAMHVTISVGAAIDCKRAASPSEHLICATSDLRALDAEISRLYGIVSSAVGKPLRASLVAGQRAWNLARDHDCAQLDCLMARMTARHETLAALAARVSESNPILPDLSAAWLEGVWRADTPLPSGVRPASDLPETGTQLSLQAGRICASENCATFGLEPQILGAGPGRETLPAILQLPADTAFYLVYLNGEAVYGLVPLPSGQMYAISPGCAASGAPCDTVRQIWQPVTSNSKLKTE